MIAVAEADAIAACVLDAFDALPAHRKPRGPSSGLKAGRREWVPLAGIVVDSGEDESPSKRLKCAALATGMKCLPQDKVIAGLNGIVLHDSHAEVLALRAFNRFLLDQCADLAVKGAEQGDSRNCVLEWCLRPGVDVSPTGGTYPEHATNLQPFRIKSGFKIHMYCSEAPCGDASMELTMAAQDDPTPWSARPKCTDVNHFDLPAEPSPKHDQLYGRSYFDKLGVVRRKPARPDAPPTLSKSCSDKLALKQCTSVLSSVSSLLIHPGNAYIQSLVLPDSQHVVTACQRAFGPQGRMAPLAKYLDRDTTRSGYHFRPFEVKATTREFSFSRRSAAGNDVTSIVPSNISSLTYGPTQETLINGILQGRKQHDLRGASGVSRRQMWALAVRIVASLGGIAINSALAQTLSHRTYRDLKADQALSGRTLMKQVATGRALCGWAKNHGDDDWSL